MGNLKKYYLYTFSITAVLGAIIFFNHWSSVKDDLPDRSLSVEQELYGKAQVELSKTYTQNYQLFSLLSKDSSLYRSNDTRKVSFLNNAVNTLNHFDYMLIINKDGRVSNSNDTLKNGKSSKNKNGINFSKLKSFKNVVAGKFNNDFSRGLVGVHFSKRIPELFNGKYTGHLILAPIYNSSGNVVSYLAGFFNLDKVLTSIEKKLKLDRWGFEFEKKPETRPVGVAFSKNHEYKISFLPDFSIVSTITTKIVKNNRELGLLWGSGVITLMLIFFFVQLLTIKDDESLFTVAKMQSMNKKTIDSDFLKEYVSDFKKAESTIEEYIQMNKFNHESMSKYFIQTQNDFEQIKTHLIAESNLNQSVNGKIKQAHDENSFYNNYLKVIQGIQKSLFVEITNIKIQVDREAIDSSVGPYLKRIEDHMSSFTGETNKLNKLLEEFSSGPEVSSSEVKIASEILQGEIGSIVESYISTANDLSTNLSQNNEITESNFSEISSFLKKYKDEFLSIADNGTPVNNLINMVDKKQNKAS
jgi:hypothetical protein